MHHEAKGFVVGFLGPLGTYTHQVAFNRFGPSVEYKECKTISDVFDAVASNVVHAGVVPQENSTFGSVAETYDALRRRGVFVQGESVLEVQHCLLAPLGVKFEDIQYIKSHEQALGQCRGFLARNFPNATLEKLSSTAAAAQAVLETSNSAAICSRICATIFQGLEILSEGIQDQRSMSSLYSVFNDVPDAASDNCTRFYFLTDARDTRLPPPLSPIPSSKRALVLLSKGSRALPITELLSALRLLVVRVDRRPQLESTQLFQDVYLVEVESERGDFETWEVDIVQAIERVRAFGGEADILGIW